MRVATVTPTVHFLQLHHDLILYLFIANLFNSISRNNSKIDVKTSASNVSPEELTITELNPKIDEVVLKQAESKNSLTDLVTVSSSEMHKQSNMDHSRAKSSLAGSKYGEVDLVRQKFNQYMNLKVC